MPLGPAALNIVKTAAAIAAVILYRASGPEKLFSKREAGVSHGGPSRTYLLQHAEHQGQDCEGFTIFALFFYCSVLISVFEVFCASHLESFGDPLRSKVQDTETINKLSIQIPESQLL